MAYLRVAKRLFFGLIENAVSSKKFRSVERLFFSAKRIALTAIVIPRKPPVPSGATLRAPCAEASLLRGIRCLQRGR